jgi:hypothetical protein
MARYADISRTIDKQLARVFYGIERSEMAESFFDSSSLAVGL